MKHKQRCITELAGILQILYGEVAVHINDLVSLKFRCSLACSTGLHSL